MALAGARHASRGGWLDSGAPTRASSPGAYGHVQPFPRYVGLQLSGGEASSAQACLWWKVTHKMAMGRGALSRRRPCGWSDGTYGLTGFFSFPRFASLRRLRGAFFGPSDLACSWGAATVAELAVSSYGYKFRASVL